MDGFDNHNYFYPFPPINAIGNPYPGYTNNFNMNNFFMMNNYSMMNHYPMFQMDQNINEPWAESYEQRSFYKMNQKEEQISPGPNKINIVFKTTSKVKTNMVADYGQTMSDVILLYLKKEGKENLFKRCSGIFFLFNAQMIDIFDETKVEDFFKNKSNALIIVNEMKFVIGA